VIGTLKAYERPFRPAGAVSEALSRYLVGADDEYLRRERAALLSVDGETVRQVSETVLRPAIERAAVCVIAHRDALHAVPVPDDHIEDL